MNIICYISMNKINIGGLEFDLEIKRKKIKNLNLHLDGNRLKVSAPSFVTQQRIMAFITDKSDWILRAYQRNRKQRDNSYLYYGGDQIYYLGQLYDLIYEEGRAKLSIEDEVIKVRYPNEDFINYFYKKTSADLNDLIELYLPECLAYLKEYGLEVKPTFQFRPMTSRWGSCKYKADKITLNSKLIHFPPIYFKHVLIHECLHFLEPNHSNNFYMHFARLQPDYKRYSKML